MTSTKIPSGRPGSNFSEAIREAFQRHHRGSGLALLVLVLLLLSLLAGANLSQNARVYIAGEVAEQDIVAERDMRLEDSQATQARREQIIARQPPVFDLSAEAAIRLNKRIHALFKEINETDTPGVDDRREQLKHELGMEISDTQYALYADPRLQLFVVNSVLPKIETKLNEGVLPRLQLLRAARAGILIRNLDTGTETLRTDSTTLADTQSLLAELSIDLKAEKSLSFQCQKAVADLVGALLMPSLSYNSEATRAQALSVVKAVEPVYYHLHRGETVARKGDRITREQQIKIQAIYAGSKNMLDVKTVAGTFVFSLFISIGLFVAPSGRSGTPLSRKDFVLISSLLLVFCCGAKALYLLGLYFHDATYLTKFSYGYPVGAVVGLAAMVFAARRYCSFGLLIALFCAAMFRGNTPLFLFYFLSGMFVTWLITRAQSRQDMVWSLVPYFLFHLVLWLGTTLLSQNPPSEYPGELVAVFVSSITTLLLLFAVSPILELIFGYTTRFRLMELMNLEQPLLQELMLAMPGTYHHSLLVANLVEAGAKAVGANSLLCKVAALFHDIGKISYPEYFIENQFGGENKHDKLAPSMSALILTSHVKKGVELAQNNRLGQEIADIIGQHHGTRLMSYFYQKAIDLGENPRHEDYCYSGPKPQSREAAIVMLADVVEASSRTLNDPTPARIAGHIDKILKGVFAEGQLDESELTFKDLHKLSVNFRRILTGLFHQRIAYPDKEKNGKAAEHKDTEHETGPAETVSMPKE